MRILERIEDADRVLPRLALAGGVLSRDDRSGAFALLPKGDRRRRPLVRLSATLVRALMAAGALDEMEAGVRYRLSAAGQARAARQGEVEGEGEGEGYRAQHDPIIARPVMNKAGDLRDVRGVDPAGPVARLAKLTNAEGQSFLSANELDAARRLCADWQRGQEGLVRGSDWSAPPRGAAPRSGGGVEAARAGAVDARRRLERALATLAPMLASAVQAACLHDQGLADLERVNQWPARSGKLALKLGLAQLAEHYRRG